MGLQAWHGQPLCELINLRLLLRQAHVMTLLADLKIVSHPPAFKAVILRVWPSQMPAWSSLFCDFKCAQVHSAVV